jgi:hypothetical protein
MRTQPIQKQLQMTRSTGVARHDSSPRASASEGDNGQERASERTPIAPFRPNGATKNATSIKPLAIGGGNTGWAT